MSRKIEEVTATSVSDGTEYTHPAFAAISASRIQGMTSLYGSDFMHQHFVTVRIAKSRLKRDSSTDWYFPSNSPYIEVDLSEAQWATFVSSMNTGAGTPCTLRRLNNEGVPGLPDPASRKDQFKAEARERCEDALKASDELIAMIDGLSLSAKAKDALRRQAQSVGNRLTSSLPFVLDQFAEHMEHTVEKAKIEINAYATATVMRAGIAALNGGDTMPAIEYNDGAAAPHE